MWSAMSSQPHCAGGCGTRCLVDASGLPYEASSTARDRLDPKAFEAVGCVTWAVVGIGWSRRKQQSIDFATSTLVEVGRRPARAPKSESSKEGRNARHPCQDRRRNG